MNNSIATATIKASTLLTSKVETKLLAICSITGIAITLEVPAIPLMALEYENPLSNSKNFLQLASLPFKQLELFEPSILAGLLLAVYKHFELLECPLSSAAQNHSLQSVNKEILIDCLKFYSSLTPKQSKLLAHFNLKPKDENELQNSTITDVIKAKRAADVLVIYPPAIASFLDDTYNEIEGIQRFKAAENKKLLNSAILRARKSKEKTQQELLTKGRKLTRALVIENILSDKLVSFLKLLFSSDYLLTAEQELKDRIIKALAKHEGNKNCVDLIKILKDAVFTNKIDSLFSNEDDKEIEQELKEVEVKETKKLSFAEMLAAKKLAAANAKGGN